MSEQQIILTDADGPPAEATAACNPPCLNALPTSLLKTPKNSQRHRGLNWVELYCANCHKGSGTFVPEKYCDFAFYLCEPCAETLGPIMGTYAEPDVLFWQRVNAAQMEEFGRILTADEQVEALKDENHILAKLARERRK